MNFYYLIAALFLLQCSGDPDAVEGTWLSGLLPDSNLLNFASMNMSDPSWAEIPSPQPESKLLLIHGRVPYLSGHSFWAAVLTDSDLHIEQVLPKMDDYGQFLDTLNFTLPGGNYGPVVFYTDSALSFLTFRLPEKTFEAEVPAPDPYISSETKAAADLLSAAGLTNGSGSDSITVINWWASWCRPCIEEIPGFNILVESYADQPVRFIAVHADEDDAAQTFLKTHPFRYQHRTAAYEAAQQFGSSFPRNLILDCKGNTVYDMVGGSADRYLELQKVLDSLLTEN